MLFYDFRADPLILLVPNPHTYSGTTLDQNRVVPRDLFDLGRQKGHTMFLFLNFFWYSNNHTLNRAIR
jgi:hypothetical protein